MDSIQINFERLSRHYKHSVDTYDKASLLDLSHILRIWADLKASLPKEISAFRTTMKFNSASPPKKICKAANGHEHVLLYLPKEVRSNAANGQLIEGPNGFGSTFANGQMTLIGSPADPDSPLHCGCVVRFPEAGAVQIKSFTWLKRELEDSEKSSLDEMRLSRGNYVEWMGAEVVRVGYTDDQGVFQNAQLSREAVIRRVANTMGGSHPSNTEHDSEQTNRNDAPIQELMKYKIAGLPVPYFILLSTAQVLLDVGKPFVEGAAAEAQR